MIKYFHELTKGEFDILVRSGITWGECATLYPEPTWCGCPDPVAGEMGCWSLMSFKVENEEFCKDCAFYNYEN